MKKNLLLLSAVALALSANAQLETTNFVGAFAPAPTEMWTNGWAEWDPQNKVYGAPTAELSTEITANTTLTNDKIWLLKNKVYVSNNATLTIQPGTIIRGDKATEGAIIIKRGSKIMAEGTAAAPIVFTSNFNQNDDNHWEFSGPR